MRPLEKTYPFWLGPAIEASHLEVNAAYLSWPTVRLKRKPWLFVPRL
jgi:hypothetical protein